MRILRILCIVVIVAFLALSPNWLIGNLRRNVYTEWAQKPTPQWQGSITLWHIAEFRTYQGKVTEYLKKRAFVYCKRHYNVHIDVTGLTLAQYEERIARGMFPDAYSFQVGRMYAEQLRSFNPDTDALLENVPAARDSRGAVCAVPYMMSGYFLCGNVQRMASANLELPKSADPAFMQRVLDAGVGLSMPPVYGARAGLTGTLTTEADFLSGKSAFALLDARALGDIQRQSAGNLSIEAVPYGGYTDQVFYIGPAKGADHGQAEALGAFASWLLSPPEQGRLSSLGALPVTVHPKDAVYAEPLLTALYASAASVTVPDPFAYQRHRGALEEEATGALTGDPASINAFWTRMHVVVNGII